MGRSDVPEYLTREDAERLVRVPSKRYPTGLRNYYIIRTFLGTGLRSSELTALRVSDVDLAHRRIIVRNGKARPGGKPRRRTVALSQSMADALALWLHDRRWDSDYLFSTAKGTPLSGPYLRAMLARYGAKAGIGKRVHPHLLRHTYLTWLYDEGVPLTTIQTQAGHDRLSTTDIYAHASGRLQNEHVAGLDF